VPDVERCEARGWGEAVAPLRIPLFRFQPLFAHNREERRHVVGFNSGRDATILMIQWVIWKHLSPMLIMDGHKFQELSEKLAYAFYDEGVRMPLDDDPETTPVELHHELLHISEEIGPPPVFIPREVVRERTRVFAQRLFKKGWRKFADVAVAAAVFVEITSRSTVI
jgi:hypothetical protein